ncbi:Ubiquinone/menaquinone biosynthesis C-methylase UbiE [Bacillus sp. OV322]|uniref:class I SAM-dependent DNA methyltransferase n=1 Tax=Bacillus sp. OV322 TaxID=1882764 RepID=UPI0008F0C8DF|nr:class I SAM-dependent methyltransferase [Bacillus sp. OV322]SFC36060.1 Ubiquinone/menaquinone biosynthesis C-methylase UbiE [Bacillus sp. OV322]
MEFRGSSVYDEAEFFTNYIKRRERPDSPNTAIEGPLMYELIGGFKGKRILDLGCGDASFGRDLLNGGAAFYAGVEGSRNMAARALSNLDGVNGMLFNETMETYSFPSNQFDIVTSRFAIHYVADINQLFQNVLTSLKETGRFIFSVQHPLTTSSFISKQSGELRENWVVNDYFLDGERKEPWIGQVVVKYPRTIEHYFRTLTQSGFTVTDLREGTPKREHFSSESEFKRRQRIPLVLAFSCVKGQR